MIHIDSLDVPKLEVIVHAWEINGKINREPKMHCARVTFCLLPVYMLWNEKIEKKRKKQNSYKGHPGIPGLHLQTCTGCSTCWVQV